MLLALAIWEWGSLATTTAATVVGIVAVLRRPREPRAMLAWILAILLLPIVGLLLFVLLGDLRLQRTRRRRRHRRQKLAPGLARHVEALRDTHEPARPHAGPFEPALHDLIHVATRLTSAPPTRGNAVTIYHDAERTFLALQLAIEAARSHVHLEYYIFQPDETGRAIRDLLIAKVRQGVQCRVLLDDIGCWRLPRRFIREFREGGVQVEFFLPVVPWRGRWHVNFRNHRKIVVIDGEVGFTGSQNIGDEYLGRRRRLGPWRDTHLRLAGPSVQQLQEIFVEDWHFATGEDLIADAYFPPPNTPGHDVVQLVASGPDQDADVLHQVLFAAVAAARHSVCIITPYFVPDTSMILALQSAALRGVHVQLLVPSRSDHWFVLWAGRSYYEELSSNGVEIYEYGQGMLHSKVVIVDQSWAMVGSANMDARSFRINFEVTTMLYDRGLAEQLQRDFDDLRAGATRIKPTGRRYWTFGESLSLGLARLASPML